MMLPLLLALSGALAAPLNPHVMAVLERYPLSSGGAPYDWVRGRHDDGVTRTLTWDGAEVARPSPSGGVHCSGITFEVWLRALDAAGARPRLSADELLALKETWYVRDGDDRGPVGALLDRGLGEPVERLEDLRPGDLVQFWRNNGNGHSAVFVGHTYRTGGAIRGMVFWSAQASSEGLGRRYVSVGPSPAQITPGRLHAVRPTLPTGAMAAADAPSDVPAGPAAR